MILPGVEEAPELPLWVRQALWVDMRNWKEKGDDSLYRLVCGILEKQHGDSLRAAFTTRDVWDWQQSIE